MTNRNNPIQVGKLTCKFYMLGIKTQYKDTPGSTLYYSVAQKAKQNQVLDKFKMQNNPIKCKLIVKDLMFKGCRPVT